ncbi:hypothetical protein ERO13_A09G041165v2 [Gossypium hirsutum]|nr:hypothetical protein ERO13_A09G041165v2 [Gossypium hirsutum]
MQIISVNPTPTNRLTICDHPAPAVWPFSPSPVAVISKPRLVYDKSSNFQQIVFVKMVSDTHHAMMIDDEFTTICFIFNCIFF